MDIVFCENNELTFSGRMESSCEYCEVKEAIYKIVKKGLGSSITINIPDANLISSYFIGIMLKLKHDERLRIVLRIGDRALLELMQDQALNRYFVLESYPPEDPDKKFDHMKLKF